MTKTEKSKILEHIRLYLMDANWEWEKFLKTNDNKTAATHQQRMHEAEKTALDVARVARKVFNIQNKEIAEYRDMKKYIKGLYLDKVFDLE